MKSKKISIVTPCFNEEGNVRDCYERLKKVFSENLTDCEYEHIFCDNSSTDDTVEILREIASRDPSVKVIINSRNFGAFNSMFNGMLAATGDAVIPFLPADSQDPPELIPQFIAKWKDGFDIVYGVRSNREETWLMHSIRKLYYRLVNQFASINIPLNVGEFTLIDNKVHNALKGYEDYYPYLRGMIASCGFTSTSISYTWAQRKRGVSKANLYGMIDAGLNGLISFTNIPMRICMAIGFVIALGSLAYAAYAFLGTLFWFHSKVQAGIPTLTIAIFLFSGINLFFLGFLGEYISAIHSQVRKRPLVIERERINF